MLADEHIYREQISSMAATRPQLEAALKFVRKGDTLLITKIDRLARSITKLMVVVEQLSAKGVALRILAPDINTGGPMGRLPPPQTPGHARLGRILRHQATACARSSKAIFVS